MYYQRARWVWILVSFMCLVGGTAFAWHWYTHPVSVPTVSQAQVKLPLRPIAAIPVKTAELSSESALLASVSAQSVYVMDWESGAQLLAKNEHQLLYPASTTKLMTALVVLQDLPLDKIIVASSSTQTEGAVLGIQPGDQFSVRDLLAALLINSSNDAALMLAGAHDLGSEGFVASMNSMANDLALTSTHFINPSGLDAIGHQSTARDLAVLARAVMSKPILRDLVGQTEKTIYDSPGIKTFHLTTTNSLLKAPTEFIGIKTGTTELAREMLISQYNHDGHSVVIVVAGSDDRYADTLLIKEWVENSYTWEQASSVTLN